MQNSKWYWPLENNNVELEREPFTRFELTWLNNNLKAKWKSHYGIFGVESKNQEYAWQVDEKGRHIELRDHDFEEQLDKILKQNTSKIKICSFRSEDFGKSIRKIWTTKLIILKLQDEYFWVMTVKTSSKNNHICVTHDRYMCDGFAGLKRFLSDFGFVK